MQRWPPGAKVHLKYCWGSVYWGWVTEVMCNEVGSLRWGTELELLRYCVVHKYVHTPICAAQVPTSTWPTSQCKKTEFIRRAILRSDASQPFVSVRKTLTLPKRKIEDFFLFSRIELIIWPNWPWSHPQRPKNWTPNIPISCPILCMHFLKILFTS